MSPGTRKAADALGLVVTSANRGGYFDVDASQWDYTNDQFVPAAEIVAQCEARFATGDDLCVIMLHPQDLLTETGELDATRWREYRKLVTYFSHERFAPTTFREIVE
jgi:hypothetical protein